VSLNYAPLWKLLIDRNMNKTQLREKAGFSTVTLAKLGKNEPVSLSVIEEICKVLDCQPGDIVENKKTEE
jgi:DNA-binding Xre family transcriptional regulator